MLLARSNGLDHPRLGLVVAKKNVRLAVERNRFKRLVRETFRAYQHQLPPIDCVFLTRKGLDQLDNATFQRQLVQQFNRLIKKAAPVQP